MRLSDVVIAIVLACALFFAARGTATGAGESVTVQGPCNMTHMMRSVSLSGGGGAGNMMNMAPAAMNRMDGLMATCSCDM